MDTISNAITNSYKKGKPAPKKAVDDDEEKEYDTIEKQLDGISEESKEAPANIESITHPDPDTFTDKVEIDNSVLPPQQTIDCGYFEKECIIEAAFRIQKFSTEEELSMILYFYSLTDKSKDKDIPMLIKCLVMYYKLDLVNQYFYIMSNDDSNSKRFQKKLSQVYDIKIIKMKDEEYTPDVFLTDVALFAIETDSIPFMIDLLEIQKFPLSQNSSLIIEEIFHSFIHQYDKGLLLTYMHDKFVIVEDLAEQYITSSTSVIKLVRVMKHLMDTPSSLNFIANFYNPLRLFVIILKAFRAMNATVISMDQEFEELEKQLTTMMLSIIDEVEVPGVLINWLYDDSDESLKVIDYLSQYRCYTFLNHSKIIKAVNHIYLGNYDWGRYSSPKVLFLSTPTVKILRSKDNDFNHLVSLIDSQGCLTLVTALTKCI